MLLGACRVRGGEGSQRGEVWRWVTDGISGVGVKGMEGCMIGRAYVTEISVLLKGLSSVAMKLNVVVPRKSLGV